MVKICSSVVSEGLLMERGTMGRVMARYRTNNDK